VFVLLYVVGGAVELPFGPLLASMLGWHTLIGLGEALITAATVGAVVAVRPDLVYAARGMEAPLVLRGADGQEIPAAAPASSAGEAHRSPWPLLVGGLGVTLILAGVVSFFASGNPDGLEFVAEEEGFIDTATDSAVGDFALADYGEVGGIPVGVAGLIGVGVTLLVGLAIFWLVSRRHAEPERISA
jgi:cobalt/nickel transport system permease protein